MEKNRSWLICVALILSSLFIQACQNVSALEYVKYDNEAAVPRISAEEAKKEYDAGNAILYCSCGGEHTSAELAFQMNQKGIPGTYALVGGPGAWKMAGFSFESDNPKAGDNTHDGHNH